MLDINKKAKEIFEANKAVGWWDDMDRCPFQTLQLVSTEISEATEGARKNLMDDKLPHRPMAEVEIADAMIRMMDFAGRYNIMYKRTVFIHFPYGDETIGACLLGLNKLLIQFAEVISGHGYEHARTFLERNNWAYEVVAKYSHFLDACLKLGEVQGYDLVNAIEEKLAYNANRPDHKREHRATVNGKSF